MNTEDALLQAIRDDPSDDAPRAACADLLSERGDPRGEFVKVQLAFAALPRRDVCRGGLGMCGPKMNCPGCNLRRREKELVEAHGANLMVPKSLPFLCTLTCGAGEFERSRFPPPVALVRRGFVEAVCGPLALWYHGKDGLEGHGPATCREHPVERFVASDKRPDHSPGERHGRMHWWEPGISFDGPHQIPFPVAEAAGWKSALIGGLMVYRFPGETVAQSALAVALAVWAREKAGLPPLRRRSKP